MTTGKDGGTAGGNFMSRCPREECGAPMAKPPQNNVSVSLESELEALKADAAELLSNPERDADEEACLKDIRRRIRRIENPVVKSTAPATLVVKPSLPAFTMPGAQPATVAVPPAAPPTPQIPSGDIFHTLRQRLAQIEVERQLLDREARKLTAVLAVADSIE